MYAQIPSLLQSAVQYFQRGELAQAAQLLQKILDAQPRNFDALHILGVIRAMEGKRAEAIELFRKALGISKNNNFLHFNLAKALTESGMAQEALQHHRKATQLAPQHAEAWLNLGKCHEDLGKYSEAISAYDHVLSIKPNYAEALNNKGHVLSVIGDESAAIETLQNAIRHDPHLADAHYNLGHIYDRKEDWEQALASYSAAISLSPSFTGAYVNRGIIFASIGRELDALADYDQALMINPHDASAHNNKGKLLMELGKYQLAKDSFHSALEIDPHHADSHWNLACLDLKLGDYSAGWQGFEYRWQANVQTSPAFKTIRRLWSGQRSENSLLVWGEQGIGDQILYASILPELSNFPQRKMVAVDKRLIPLFDRSMSGFEFLNRSDISDSLDFDEQLPIGSLPAHFRPSKESFAHALHPFLKADPQRVESLNRIVRQTGKLICGVSWHSSRKNLGRHKSISLDQLLAPLASERLHFVDLQYGNTADERVALHELHGISVQRLEEIDNFNDIDGLAALIMSCDVVITTSNTTAHLAGALGKTTLLLLPYARGRLWYWSDIDGRNPWYPSITMFSQPEQGDWQTPLEKIRATLERKIWN